jgi:Domain of unknown function (DUF4159)
MTHPFPPPSIEPLERLNAYDGLMINADRWKRAHAYHRQRQNAHYQSLNQPGIVCGLGVRVIPAPSQSKARDRDQRWLQVQPGLAIDLHGNVIVIPRAFNYHIETEIKGTEPLTIYLVTSYRDPEELQRSLTGEMIQETYRLEEITRTPGSLEVELCRLLLQTGRGTLTQPEDVFFPGYNQLDLRYRVPAQSRPQALVRLAQVNREDPDCSRNFFNLTHLLQAVEVLYPSLKGADELGQVTFVEGGDRLQPYDVLYLTGNQKLELSLPELNALKAYLDQGGVLLVDIAAEAIELRDSVQQLAQQLGTPLQPLTALRNHPLRIRPFLFAALPLSHQQPIQVALGGGILLITGDLASSWGPDQDLNLSRIMIRTAQELGINLLHYAWRRRQLTGLQQEDSSGQW